MEQNAVDPKLAEHVVNPTSTTGTETEPLPQTVLHSDGQPQASPTEGPETHLITLTSAEMEDYRKWQRHKRTRNILELKTHYSSTFPSRRNTLVLRRVDCKEIAPDEDVLAYLLIYEMKEPSTLDGKKVIVSDYEIRAFIELNPDFIQPLPSLQEIKEKAAELGDTGKETDEQ